MVAEPVTVTVTGEVDGRTARRDRNRLAVLDAVLELFSEGDLVPSPDDVARRSGVSLRSVYRYVADADDLIRSAIERNLEKVEPLFLIADLGTGSFAHRIDAFLDARMRVYDAIAATARASRLAASRSAVIRSHLEGGRRAMRVQLERQFASELDCLDGAEREAAAAAADALTQIETIELYRCNRGFTSEHTRDLLAVALRALLTRM